MSYSDVECVNNEHWAAPTPDHFNTVHDCTLFARYLSLLLRYDVQFSSIAQLDHDDRLAHQQHKLCRVPIIATENYIMDSLPPELRPTSCQLIEWYYGNGSICTEADYSRSNEEPNRWDPYVDKLVYAPRLACNKELRSALGLAGNPDIAGIGVRLRHIPIRLDELLMGESGNDLILHRGRAGNHVLDYDHCHKVQPEISKE